MAIVWKVILTILILQIITIDGNRARRRRRQVPLQNPNLGGNNIAQQLPPPGPNPQILNSGNDLPTGKQGSRQYYYPYQGQMGYGSIQSLNYPYAGAGVGTYNYGSGQYGQVGSYGNYYNPYQSSGGFYSGSGSYNRPGYSSNYYPSSYGGNYFGGGGYYWGAGQKHTINTFLLILSSLLTFIIYLITN